jgi:hypothetical protein
MEDMELTKVHGCALAVVMAGCFTAASAMEGQGVSEASPANPTATPMHVPGADAIDAASAPSGAAGTTGYLFVAGSAFTPRSSAAPVVYTGAGCINSVSDFVVTDLQLPAGVSVLGIRSYYYNNGQATSVTTALTSYDGAGGFTDQIVANSTLNTGYADEYTGAVTPVVIDNGSLFYLLLATTPVNLQFCGIRVFYQNP